MGFVPQDDVLHGDLTVEEVLLFSARVRLPASAEAADHRSHVDRALRVRPPAGWKACQSTSLGTLLLEAQPTRSCRTSEPLTQ